MRKTKSKIIPESADPRDHPFIHFPNYTLITMAFPVLLSLVAEPLTGLVDTAFISRLGSESLAALGVGTVGLSGIFWIFGFLGIGTQTEVSQALGRQASQRAIEIGSLALALAAIIGFLILVFGLPLVPYFSAAMGAEGTVHDQASQYLKYRLFGAPAVLMTIAAFGILRGLQNMRTPLWIALSINFLNILLDLLLIFGYGPIPALGVVGAAIASVISQWIGAFSGVIIIFRKMGWPSGFRMSDIRRLLRIGRELFIRTGLATVFFLLTTRVATRIGPDAGAAHQAIRQVWVFTTLFLDSYAITAQSLVGYFIGPSLLQHARRVSSFVIFWSFATGLILSLIMLLGQNAVIHLIVPTTAIDIFIPAWIVSAIAQPINALAYATDGIHWGTGDFRFLRNVMLTGTLCCTLAIFLLDDTIPDALTWIWIITCSWILIRGVFGVMRVWPGIGKSPLKS